MAEIFIRKAEEKDLDAIVRLEEQCFVTPWSRESLSYDMMENSLSSYLVADRDGQPAGYVGIWSILDEGHINNVAVSPDCRRQGIGTLLIDALLQEGRKEGITSFTLEVRVGNLPARRLYEKAGFEEAGIRRGYYEDNGEDAIIMWRYEK